MSAGLSRWLATVIVLLAALISEPVRASPPPEQLRLFADRDDDDNDGVADGQASRVRASADADVYWLPDAQLTLGRIDGDAVRALDDGIVVTPEELSKTGSDRLGLQGVRAGRARIELNGKPIQANVVELVAIDGAGRRIDLATSHASIARSLPRGLGQPSPSDERESLRWLAIGPPAALPFEASLFSIRPGGSVLDKLEQLQLHPTQCPAGVSPELECRATPAIRATIDDIDRSHPDSSRRSLRAEVGGKLIVRVADQKAASIRVGGPRRSSLGPLPRFRAQLRMKIIRMSPGGSPPIGGDVAAAVELGQQEIRTASALWGQCGIHFGADSELDVEVVDPPGPHMLAVGCELGTPASGGQVTFQVGGRRVQVTTKAGQSPTQVAHLVAKGVRAAGYEAIVSVNARVHPGALRTADVLARDQKGRRLAITQLAEQPISTDPSLTACIANVDLTDGLRHFNDFNAVAGTVEERALIKAYDDGDPSTIDIFVVPSFSQTGRIGESFIFADGASVRNVVIIGRAGIRAGARSFVLAHELGHILLDMPGHPDDFGVDKSTSLMDADASDPTIFGPRRLTVEECERAVVQSGPGAPVPLFQPWPLYERDR